LPLPFPLGNRDTGTDEKAPTLCFEAKSASQKEDIEKIVREYLLENPAVIRGRSGIATARGNAEKRRDECEFETAQAGNLFNVDSPVAGNPLGDVRSSSSLTILRLLAKGPACSRHSLGER